MLTVRIVNRQYECQQVKKVFQALFCWCELSSCKYKEQESLGKNECSFFTCTKKAFPPVLTELHGLLSSEHGPHSGHLGHSPSWEASLRDRRRQQHGQYCSEDGPGKRLRLQHYGKT